MSPITRRGAAAGLTALAALAPGAAFADPLEFRDAEVLPGRKDATSRLTTPVFINGSGPYAFIVDTGASRSVIAAELAGQLGLPPGRAARIHGILGVQETATVEVSSFAAGTLRLPLSGVPTLRRADLGCDGFLGLDAFRNRRVAFDFRHGRVAIQAASYEDLEGGRLAATLTSDVIVRARQRLGQLTITEAEVAGKWISCFIDSGAQISVGNLALRRLLKRRTGDRDFAPIPVVLYGATGQEAYGEVAAVPHLRLGLLNFTDFNMAFADLHTFSLWDMQDRPALMVGMDLLSLFELVIVDFRQNFVRFRMSQLLQRELVS